MKKKSLKKQIEEAQKLGDGAKLRIPFSYHRIGKIMTSEQFFAEIAAEEKKIKARKKRLQRLGLWD